MSTDTLQTPKWLYLLIGSVALNGLLAGMLISSFLQPKPEIVSPEPSVTTQTQISPSTRERPAQRGLQRTAYDNPKGLIAHLEPVRRREVMSSAMKQFRKQDLQGPRDLLVQLRNSHKHAFLLLQADPLDEAAFKEHLKENRVLKEKLAVQGDALIVEILKQLTHEERKGAIQSLHKARRKRFKRKSERRKIKHKERDAHKKAPADGTK